MEKNQEIRTLRAVYTEFPVLPEVYICLFIFTCCLISQCLSHVIYLDISTLFSSVSMCAVYVHLPIFFSKPTQSSPQKIPIWSSTSKEIGPKVASRTVDQDPLERQIPFHRGCSISYFLHIRYLYYC